MKHLETLEAFILTLINSDTFHALVVSSLPGWGKSTAIDRTLLKCGVEPITAGSYATPLHIYDIICRHPTSVIVLDDCAGLFGDHKTMAILKAATWQSSGQGMGLALGTSQRPRRVSWGSTSEKVKTPWADFSGKIILLTNSIPYGKETEAFLSRCLTYKIQLTENDIQQMLFEAAASQIYFPRTELAFEVTRFLVDDTRDTDLMKISFRTLKMGYDLAATHPETWRELFVHILPKRIKDFVETTSVWNQESREVASVRDILQSSLSPREQEVRFVAITGKSRRTFYNYKKRLGLTRAYQSQSS